MLRAILLAVFMILSGCAGNPPRLCLREGDEISWSPLSSLPKEAAKLERLALASPPAFSGTSFVKGMRSYWHGGSGGKILLCHQTPGANDFCFSEVWVFSPLEEQWRIEDSQWNLCTE